jgi:hypothetical protein
VREGAFCLEQDWRGFAQCTTNVAGGVDHHCADFYDDEKLN